MIPGNFLGTVAAPAVLSGLGSLSDPFISDVVWLPTGLTTDLAGHTQTNTDCSTTTSNLTGTVGGVSVDLSQGVGLMFQTAAASGDHLQIDNPSTDFTFPGDFTIEAFVYVPTGNGSDHSIYESPYAGSGDDALLRISSGAFAQFFYPGGSISASGVEGIINDALQHIAVSRSGSDLRLYLNGAEIASATKSGTIGDGGTPRQGTEFGATSQFITRVTKGVARYSGASYAVPSCFPVE